MNLNDLIVKMRDLADSQVGINDFIFDDLAKINAGAGNDYPLLFVMPGDSSIRNIDDNFELLDVSMWVLDLFNDNERQSSSIEQKWSDTHALGVQYLRQLKAVNAELGIGASGDIKVIRGQMLHNDSLMGTKYEFKIRLTTDCDQGVFE